ncbi:prolipoprotein diacylglyceryl transferase [Cellvibrio mixtus]|uniref:prolipoprotein diacylglyceryl transferase n=1 Tax=Cellvibrio mixtus TaxID=39650 RepID=UPI00058677B2|nr:prolipoprotein diacylglyceryl transferase family protein [Cellvibrio mixtus]
MAYPYITDVINDLLGTDIHLPIATFGALVAIAIFAAIHVMRIEVQRRAFVLNTVDLRGQEPKSLVTDLGFVTVIVGILGAKLFDAIEQPQRLLSEPMEVIFSTGGFSIYGGLILGCLAGVIFLKQKNIAILPMLDAVAPALSLGYAIGRLGCQFSGDGDWGKPAAMELKPHWLPDWLWAQTYPNNVVQVDIPAPGVYPTPLYEVAGALFIFAILWQLRHSLKITGQLFCVYLILSSAARWLVETIRINYQYEILGISLSQAQIISIALIVAGATGLLVLHKTNVQRVNV